MTNDTLPQIPGITLIKPIGAGSTATVFSARQASTNRIVAVKLTKLDGTEDGVAAEMLARAKIEAHILGRVNSTHVAQVHDFGLVARYAYLVQEMIDGETLKASIARAPFTVAETVALGRTMLFAVALMHTAGITSLRDIKPANIMLRGNDRRQPVLIDVALARVQGSTHTRVGAALYSPSWAAPEQFRCEEVDERTDNYCVGATLYNAVTGRKPFDGDNEFQLMRQVLETELVPPSVRLPGLPRSLDAVLARAMAKDRKQRYATAEDFMEALDRAGAELASAAPRQARTPRDGFGPYVPPWARPVPEAGMRRPLRRWLTQLAQSM